MQPRVLILRPTTERLAIVVVLVAATVPPLAVGCRPSTSTSAPTQSPATPAPTPGNDASHDSSSGAVPAAKPSIAPRSTAQDNAAAGPLAVAPRPLPPERAAMKSSITFTPLSQDIGLDFVHQNGEAGERLMVEAMGGGAGWLDIDGDQLADLYLCQGGDPKAMGDERQPSDRLFRQLSDHTFREVSIPAGIIERKYSQGVAVADYDADGFDDVYVCNLGENTLWRNQGDGTFVEVAQLAGVADNRWSVSAAWADLDGDDDLDLYVCNYCNYDIHNPVACTKDGKPFICHPLDVPDIPDECYINLGDGTFRAEAKERGLTGKDNRALGVIAADFDNDGDVDLYVANDMSANYLFVNDGTGHFQDQAIVFGCAYNRNGSAQASMGLACGDYDGNGFLDIYSTHFQSDSNTLYQNLGPGAFRDVTGIMGLHGPTLAFLGFGTVMQDFDRDGYQELLVANGHIMPTEIQSTIVHAMRAQRFVYDGKRFQDVSTTSGDYFQQEWIGRGVATCDFDGDGDLDVCMVHQNTPTVLLRNDVNQHHWLAFRFQGAGLNRRGINARVTVECGGKSWMQELCGGTSYASSHQPLLHFGLGDVTGPATVTIRWPGGEQTRLADVALDQLHVVSAGSGKAVGVEGAGASR